MTKAHEGTTLPLKTSLPVDEHTTFLAHYDVTVDESLRGIKPLGDTHSLRFNGKDNDNDTSVVEIGRDFGNMELDDFTIQAWIKTTHIDSSRTSYIVSKSLRGTQDHRFGAGIRDGKIRGFMRGDGGTDITPTGTTFISDGNWHHVAYVYKRDDSLILYVDGKEETREDISHWKEVNMVSTNPFRIGSYTDSDNQTARSGLPGNINNVIIHRRALSPEEIQTSMYGEPSEEDLIAYWKLNEGEGSFVRNYAADEGHGYIQGETIWDFGQTVATLRPNEGKYGGAVAVEEGTTNFASIYPEDRFIRCTGTRHDPFNFTIIPNSDAISCHGGHTQAFTPEWDNLTISYWARVVEGPDVRAGIYTTLSRSEGSDTINNTLVTNKWTKVVGTFTNTSGTSNRATWLFLTIDGKEFGQSKIEIKDFQIEDKPFATSFVNGSRPEGVLRYPIEILPYEEGTLSFWMKQPQTLPYNPSSRDSFFSTSGRYNASDSLNFGKHDGFSKRILGIHWGGVNGSYMHLSDTIDSVTWFNIDDWNMITLTWKHDVGYKYYINGRFVSQAVLNNGDVLTPFMSDEIVIKNMSIDELRIDKIARSEEEIRQWYESQSPFYPKGIHRVYL